MAALHSRADRHPSARHPADDRDRRRLRRPQQRSRTSSATTKTFGLPACTKHDKSACTQVNQKGEAEPLPQDRRLAGRRRSRSTSRSPTRSARTVTSCSSRPNSEDTQRGSRSGRGHRRQAHRPTRSRTPGCEPEPATDSPAFDHPGVVITAGSGDEGYLQLGARLSRSRRRSATRPPRPTWWPSAGTRLEDSSWDVDVLECVERRRVSNDERGPPAAAAANTSKPPTGSSNSPTGRSVGLLKAGAPSPTSPPSPIRSRAWRSTTRTPLRSRSGPARLGNAGRHERRLAVDRRYVRARRRRPRRRGPEVEYPARTLYENAALKPRLGDTTSKRAPTAPCLAQGGLRTEDGLEPVQRPPKRRQICFRRGDLPRRARAMTGPPGSVPPTGSGVFQPTGVAAKKPQQIELLSQRRRARPACPGTPTR